MCIAFPGKIVKVEADTATIDYLDEIRQANVGSTKLEKGDYVLVQAGFVIKKLDKKEAQKSIKLLKTLMHES